MKILDDIISSISGNTKTRISDPLVGAFIISWITCNWNHLAILIWGEGKISERVNEFYIFTTESKLIALNTLFIIPALLTIFYLFLLPWVSLLSKSILELANSKLHHQAIKAELNQINSQKHLNEAKLLSNPDKPFLEESVKLSLNRKNEVVEHLKQRTMRLTARALEAKSESDEAAARAAEALSKTKISQLEEDNRSRQAELERSRFQVESARLRALHESNRFPSAYLYMSMIEDSMKLDEIYLSLTSTAEIVAAIFGYKHFSELLKDTKFNNEDLSKIEYIFYDKKELAQKFQDIVADEPNKNENLTSDSIFDHTMTMLETLSMRLVTMDDIVEKSTEFFEEQKYELFENDKISSVIAISNTTYEEIEIENIDYIKHNSGFWSCITATASGSHFKFERAPGQKMRILAEIKGNALVGKNALGALVFGDITGSIIDAHLEVD